MGKRKCKTCGNLFEPKNPNDRYCSSLCRTAGCFIGGGGDTSKPNTEVRRIKPKEKKQIKTVGKDYPRVWRMMELPPSERWSVSKDFTEEERAFAKKLAKRSLMDDRIVQCISDWDWGEEEDENAPAPSELDKLGESDDGSV